MTESLATDDNLLFAAYFRFLKSQTDSYKIEDAKRNPNVLQCFAAFYERFSDDSITYLIGQIDQGNVEGLVGSPFFHRAINAHCPDDLQGLLLNHIEGFHHSKLKIKCLVEGAHEAPFNLEMVAPVHRYDWDSQIAHFCQSTLHTKHYSIISVEVEPNDIE